MVDYVTNELLLEHLKIDMRGVKGHMASFMQSEVAQDNAIATLQAGLDRIERRLELSD